MPALSSTPTPPAAEAPAAVGVLLAAGAGSRMGRPKALVVGDDGEPWLARGVRVLLAGGCSHVLVVLGAEAAAARALLAASIPFAGPVTVVEAADWASGMAASLRTGLAAAGALLASENGAAGADGGDGAVAITLVDLPALEPAAVRRLLAGAGPTGLRQAFYRGRPGHPVVVGSAHLAALAGSLHGDVGARPYLVAHGVEPVDCSDLGGGDDVDSRP